MHSASIETLLETCFASKKQSESAWKQLGCGQAAGYAQDQMCRNDFFVDKPFFLQHLFWLDTILVQPVRVDVNC